MCRYTSACWVTPCVCRPVILALAEMFHNLLFTRCNKGTKRKTIIDSTSDPPITTTHTDRFHAQCFVISSSQYHNGTITRINRTELKKTLRTSVILKKRRNSLSKSLRIICLTSGRPKPLCRQPQLCPPSYVVFVHTPLQEAIPCGRSNQKAPQSRE